MKDEDKKQLYTIVYQTQIYPAWESLAELAIETLIETSDLAEAKQVINRIKSIE